VIPVGFFWTGDQVVISPGYVITEGHPKRRRLYLEEYLV
jgi:hypothetical protein